MLPFVIIILLILMEHLPEVRVAPMKITSAASVKKVATEAIPTNTMFPVNIRLSKRAVTSFARFTLPLLELGFVLVYSIVALVIYLSEM
jgi:hypothetical protein